MEQIKLPLTPCTKLNYQTMYPEEVAELAAQGNKEAIAELKRRGLI